MKILKVIVPPLFLYTAYFLYLRFNLFPAHLRPAARHLATLRYIDQLKEVKKFDYLVIGDSTCLHNIVPEKLSEHSYGACFSGASLMDIYYEIKKFDLKKVKKGLLFSNSFNGELHYEEDFWRRSVLLGSYTLEELHELYETGRAQNIFPYTRYSKLEFFFKVLKTRLFLTSYAIGSLSEQLRSMQAKDFGDNIFTALNKRHGFIPMSLSRENAILPAELYFDTYEKFYAHPFVMNKTDEFYFEEILGLIKKENLALYFIEPILSDGVTHKDASSFKTGYRRYFQSRINQVTKGRYLIPDASPFMREDFFDYNHLQFNAAYRSTEKLKEQMLSESVDFN